ncbi:carbonic anhydrase family protein [Flavihumibacter sp. R14]|nr:carbonic anhydrase family protein [Flavihumibacter soli]
MNQIRFSHMGLVFILACMLSCNSKRAGEEENASADSASIQSERPAHWSYSEEGGPAGWAELSPVYALCGSGKSQSPVNILSDAVKGSAEWRIDYKKTPLEIAHHEHVEELINNGHTIQVTPHEGSTITYSGKVYHLKQFHFHTPSEHTINGKHYPMEIHLVHEADDKSLAVIGVLVQEGKHNSNFDQLIKYLPNAAGERKTHDSVSIDVSMNIPEILSAWHYIGSLTTPPCSENVQWLVLTNPVAMSMEQLSAFSSRLKNNNRPVQALNGRMLTIETLSSKN